MKPLDSGADVRATVSTRAISARVATLGLILGAALAIQIFAGAYRVERGSYPDEAAHFLNGMLVRDYVREALGANPVAFAESYYLRFPKIAPGMWPPLFHGVLGVVLLPGWSPQIVALGLVGFALGWAAWRLHDILSRTAGRAAGLLAVSLFLLTPVVVQLSSAVMLDIVIAAWAIEATYWLARYAASGARRHAVIFGLLTAFCCLTKGNGVALVLAPPFLILLTRRYDLLRRSGLYIAAAIVVLLAVPPLAISFRLDAAIGDFGPVHLSDASIRTSFYLRYIAQQMGIVVALLAAVGLWRVIRTTRGPAVEEPPWNAALASLLLAGLTFHLANPHLVYAGRYVTLVMPALLGLAVTGAYAITNALPSRRQQVIRAAIAVAACAAFVASHPRVPRRSPMGYRAIVDQLDAQRQLAGRRLLIVSDEGGEGALVSEVATRGTTPSPAVIRGSKLLASDDWGGRFFRQRFTAPSAVLQSLEDLHVGYVLLDRSPGALRLAYWPQVREMLDRHPDRVERLTSFEPGSGVAARPIEVYRLRFQSDGPAAPIDVDLNYSLGRVLKEIK
jgi:hypothetical protein